MSFSQYIKEIGRGAEGSRSLSFEEARLLYGAMLDGGVTDLQLGAILIALRMKGESTDEMAGFLEACHDRVQALRVPMGTLRPIVIPSYNGARKSANLTPLLALLLRQYGVPVVVHGTLEGYGRVNSAHVMREFGVLPCSSATQLQQAIDDSGFAFAPISVISGGLSALLSLRGALGLRNSAHSLVKMLDPFKGGGVLLAAATHPAYLDMMRQLLLRSGGRALLFRATEGEPYANPKRRPQIEFLHDGITELLFEAEHDSLRSLPVLPESVAAEATVEWMRRVLDGQTPLPSPLANQLACCLYASGYADDFNQAKALVAIKTKVGL